MSNVGNEWRRRAYPTNLGKCCFEISSVHPVAETRDMEVVTWIGTDRQLSRKKVEEGNSTDPLSPSRPAPGLLLLLERLGPSPFRSRPGERPLLATQFWSSVTMGVAMVSPSVGILIPLLEGAISCDCHAEEEGEVSEK